MSRHLRHDERTFPAARQALTLFGGTLTRLIAFVVVVLSMYPLVQGQSGAAPAGPDGFVTAARGAEREDDGKDDDEDDDEERAPNSAAAVARAGARAEGIAQAARVAQAAPAAQDAATGAAGGSRAGSSVALDDAATALPPLPAPVGSPGQAAGGALSWAPPAGYAKYPVKRVTAVDALTVVDGGGGDVYIELSRAHAVGPVTIRNCRNAVLIGGAITVLPTAQIDGQDQRAIYVSKCTGTVHIEGLYINGAVAGSQADGIAVNAPQALVQIQNVRVEGMRGAKSGNHADVFQPWGGVREFRIDRLTGSTNYQGLHIKRGQGPIGRGTIRNTNIASSEAGPIDGGGQFIWMDCNGYPLTLDNLYIAGRSGKTFSTSIWPKPDAAACPSVITAGVASWPGYSSLSGSIREGRPAADFVPAASVGPHYVSPGYL